MAASSLLRRISIDIDKDPEVDDNNTVKEYLEQDKVHEKDDYLVKTIGAFGLWQAVVYVMVMLTRFIAMWNVMSLSFLTPVIEFVCVEFSGNVTTVVNNSVCYNNCLKYQYSNVMGRTIIEEFGLICEKAWLASFTQSILMFGVLIGVSLFGWISDRFGRRKALIISTFLNAVFMVALPFSPSYIIFTSIRFVIGIATGGSFVTSIVHVMEITGKQHRETAGACALIPDNLAQACLAGFAYFTSNWQGYTLSYGAVTWFIFIVILFVPESPRWLVSRGKVDEATKIITGAAIRNKINTSDIKAEIRNAFTEIDSKSNEIVKTSYLDFMKSRALFVMTLVVFIIWLGLGICFYGLYQYITIIGFDPYLTVVMIGLISVPFCPLSVFLNRRLGRKVANIGLFAAMSLAMLILFFIPRGHWFGTLLGTMSFITNNIAYSISNVYVTELFPTPLRNMSYGLASSAAKLGAMIAPFIATLSPRWLPVLLFCILPIISGLCCFLLPETKGRNLKDTI